ncbi:uncharacterized protein [Scyliorhinus torazame]|uniref:uncharacterized protein isoform X2 n=1 Tax=Scyliorhinus torazame TaxID=75743 RepID=UPI003B594087
MAGLRTLLGIIFCVTLSRSDSTTSGISGSVSVTGTMSIATHPSTVTTIDHTTTLLGSTTSGMSGSRSVTGITAKFAQPTTVTTIVRNATLLDKEYPIRSRSPWQPEAISDNNNLSQVGFNEGSTTSGMSRSVNLTGTMANAIHPSTMPTIDHTTLPDSPTSGMSGSRSVTGITAKFAQPTTVTTIVRTTTLLDKEYPIRSLSSWQPEAISDNNNLSQVGFNEGSTTSGMSRSVNLTGTMANAIHPSTMPTIDHTTLPDSPTSGMSGSRSVTGITAKFAQPTTVTTIVRTTTLLDKEYPIRSLSSWQPEAISDNNNLSQVGFNEGSTTSGMSRSVNLTGTMANAIHPSTMPTIDHTTLPDSPTSGMSGSRSVTGITAKFAQPTTVTTIVRTTTLLDKEYPIRSLSSWQPEAISDNNNLSQVGFNEGSTTSGMSRSVNLTGTMANAIHPSTMPTIDHTTLPDSPTSGMSGSRSVTGITAKFAQPTTVTTIVRTTTLLDKEYPIRSLSSWQPIEAISDNNNLSQVGFNEGSTTSGMSRSVNLTGTMANAIHPSTMPTIDHTTLPDSPTSGMSGSMNLTGTMANATHFSTVTTTDHNTILPGSTTSGMSGLVNVTGTMTKATHPSTVTMIDRNTTLPGNSDLAWDHTLNRPLKRFCGRFFFNFAGYVKVF